MFFNQPRSGLMSGFRPIGLSIGLLTVLCLTNPAYAQTLPNPPTNLGFGEQNAAFPDATTTGVPSGVSLKTSGGITSTSAGQVIDSLNISGTVRINHNNVVIRRSRIRGSGYKIIEVANGLTGVRVEDCEVDGLGLSGSAGSAGVYGPVTVSRSDIRGVENGVSLSTGSVLEDSYIHDLDAPGSPHVDGVQIDGARSNIVIRGNTIDLSERTSNAAVKLANYFGPISNVKVSNNRLMGAGYTIYVTPEFDGGPISGVSITENRIKPGKWGYLYPNYSIETWSGNVDDATGKLVQP